MMKEVNDHRLYSIENMRLFSISLMSKCLLYILPIYRYIKHFWFLWALHQIIDSLRNYFSTEILQTCVSFSFCFLFLAIDGVSSFHSSGSREAVNYFITIRRGETQISNKCDAEQWFGIFSSALKAVRGQKPAPVVYIILFTLQW